MIDRKLIAAALIPIAGICALIARAELRRTAGDQYLIPIAGYDPRDLLSGHYLRFRYDWEKLGVDKDDDCRWNHGDTCCICLRPGPGGDLMHPQAESTSCASARDCAAFVEGNAAWEPGRVYIPETQGDRLQNIVRDRRAAVMITPQRSGVPTVNALYIDDRPWQEAGDK